MKQKRKPILWIVILAVLVLAAGVAAVRYYSRSAPKTTSEPFETPLPAESAAGTETPGAEAQPEPGEAPAESPAESPAEPPEEPAAAETPQGPLSGAELPIEEPAAPGEDDGTDSEGTPAAVYAPPGENELPEIPFP